MINLEPTFLSLTLMVLIIMSAPMYFRKFASRLGAWYLLSISLAFYFFAAGYKQLLLIVVLAVLTRYAAKKNTKPIYIFTIGLLILSIVISKWIIAFDEKNVLHYFIPLGISFFTFEFIHYLTEVKKGSIKVGGARDYYLFAFFFPTVVSGPIKRAQDFTNQINLLTRPSGKLFLVSVQRIALGVIYKFAADYLVSQQELAFPHLDNAGVTKTYIFFMIISFRIFLDFAGYSLIAIGLAGLYGILVPQNFRAPYLSLSIIEFWNRWHISLSSWVRDYLYIPLGGSRKGKLKQSFNLLVAMLVIGLWHGFGTNFIVWGLYQGLGLTINHMWRQKFSQTSYITSEWPLLAKLMKVFLVFTFVSVGWLFFFYPVGEAISILIHFCKTIWEVNL
jgi:alginate O-acetyltransferase complex protein AlgI